MKDLSGAVAVTVTPFINGYKPNLQEIRRQTEFLCNSSIDGIFPNTSTGEYPKISFEDKIEILRVVAEQSEGRKTLYAGACGASEEEVKSYIKAAKEFGYDACVVCPPYYYPLQQINIVHFYKEICAFMPDMPIIAYNVHFFTTEITLDTFKELLKIENLVGMKDSSGNLKKISHECDVASVKENFVIYSGTDDCLLPSLIAGVKGSMTALGAIYPEKIKEIYGYKENLQKALAVQKSILPQLRLADSLLFPYGYKLLAKANGLNVGEIPDIDDKAVIDRLYQKILESIK